MIRPVVAALVLLAFLPGFLRVHGGQVNSGSVQNVIGVAISNENILPSASIGTVIGHLTATTDNGPFTGTYSMVNTGASSDGTTFVPQCTGASNDFQVVSTGTGTADLENLNVIATPQIYGGAGTLSPFRSVVCVKATPISGASYIFPFSIMVRNPTFTSFSPQTVQYSSPPFTGTLATLSTTMCWTDCQKSGSPPAVTFTVGSDPACTGLSISGASLVAASYSGSGVCQITATAAGVGSGMLGTSGSNYVARVYVASGSYVGPGDATYANGATGLPWTVFTAPYAYSAASAAAGSPIWQIIRERDGTNVNPSAEFTINALSTGDMDMATLANTCDTSLCYIMTAYNQAGDGNNDMPTWAAHIVGNGTISHRPIVVFSQFGAMPAITNSNGSDRFLWNNLTYDGAATTGTLWVDAYENNGTGGSLIELPSNGIVPVVELQFAATAGARLYTGPYNQTGGSEIDATASVGALHSMIGVIGASDVSPFNSVFKVDGTEVTGNLLTTISMTKPLGFSGGYGGGSNEGFAPQGGVSPTAAIANQRQALCQFDQQHYGTTGSC